MPAAQAALQTELPVSARLIQGHADLSSGLFGSVPKRILEMDAFILETK